MKKLLFTLLITVLALCSILFTVSCDRRDDSGEPTPPPTNEELLEKAFDTSFSPKGANAQKLSSVMKEAIKAGSFELKVEDLSQLELIPFVDDVSIKSYVSDNKEAIVISGTDADGNSGSIIAHFDGEKFIISSPSVQNNYGISIDKISSMLPEGNDVAIPSIESDKLTQLFNSYFDYVKESIKKNSTLTLDEAESGFTFSYVISNENAHTICNDILTKIKSDNELSKIINELEIDFTFEEVLEIIDEALAELPSYGGELSFVVKTDKEYKITSIDLTVKADFDDDEDATTSVLEEIISIKLLVEDNKKTLSVAAEEFKFAIISNVEDNLTNYKEIISIEVEMPDELGASSKVSFDILSIELNKLSKSYEASLNIPQSFSAKISGQLDISDEKLTFSISNVSITSLDEYDEAEKIELPINATIIINKADTMPSIPTSYEDISELTEDETYAIIEELSEDPFFGNLIGMLMPAPEYDYEYDY